MHPDDYDPVAFDGATSGLAKGVAGLRHAYILSGEPPLDQYAWDKASELARADAPFTALIAAALYRADTTNAALIRACWPELSAAAQRAYDTGSPHSERVSDDG